jgi:hypothetical protein
LFFLLYIIHTGFSSEGRGGKKCRLELFTGSKIRIGRHPIRRYQLSVMDLVKGIYKGQEFRNDNIKIRWNFFMDIKRR